VISQIWWCGCRAAAHDVEAHPPTHPLRAASGAGFPNTDNGDLARRDRGLNLKQSTPLGSARLEEATAGQSGGQTTASPGPMEHRA
jgi:hypothetical protein